MDQLEKYIKDNRAAFDERKPPEDIWRKLDQQLGSEKPHKTIRLWRGFRVAASVLLLIGIGSLLGMYVANRNFAAESIADKLPNDFLELEEYYQKEINGKLIQLASFQSEKQTVEMDMEQLDAALQELKEDILSAPKGSEEQIINAMILNYRTKIELLETVMEHINQNSQTNQNVIKNETINL